MRIIISRIIFLFIYSLGIIYLAFNKITLDSELEILLLFSFGLIFLLFVGYLEVLILDEEDISSSIGNNFYIPSLMLLYGIIFKEDIFGSELLISSSYIIFMIVFLYSNIVDFTKILKLKE